MSKKLEPIIIDAANKSLGRLSTEVATALRGKNKVTFQPNIMCSDIVKVINIAKVKLTGKKSTQKIYRHYTGYPGGLKTQKVAVFTPAQLLKKALDDMLPKNRTRKKILKRLIIE